MILSLFLPTCPAAEHGRVTAVVVHPCRRAGIPCRAHQRGRQHEHLRQTRLRDLRFLPRPGTGTHAGTHVLEPVDPQAGIPGCADQLADGGRTGGNRQADSRAELEELIKTTASAQQEELNWRESIVDLMKLFKLDSSLGPARSWPRSWATPARSMARRK